MLQQIKNIRNIGIILGFPTLVAIGIFLYTQQIEILNKENALLRERLDASVQSDKAAREIIVLSHDAKVERLQHEISQLKLTQYSAALSELEAQEKLFAKDKKKLLTSHTRDKDYLRRKIGNLNSLISEYEDRLLIQEKANLKEGILIWDKGEAHVALTWGKHPKNLELHAYIGEELVNTMNYIGNGGVLDRDDKDGYGPELISLSDRLVGQTYLFAVTNNDGFIDLSSNATVNLYFDNRLMLRQKIPKMKEGNKWLVFAINGQGVITSINKIIN